MNKLILIGMMGLTGCATLFPGMPGEVATYESKTDNSKQVSMKPGFLPGYSGIKLGLFKTSNMKPDEVYIEVATSGDIPATKDGLTINIDGTKTVYSSIDTLTDIGSDHYFVKRYPATMDLVRQMVAGKSVWVKVNYNGQSMSEGEFSIDQMSSAKRGFTKFLVEVDTSQTRVPSSK